MKTTPEPTPIDPTTDYVNNMRVERATVGVNAAEYASRGDAATINLWVSPFGTHSSSMILTPLEARLVIESLQDYLDSGVTQRRKTIEHISKTVLSPSNLGP